MYCYRTMEKIDHENHIISQYEISYNRRIYDQIYWYNITFSTGNRQ